MSSPAGWGDTAWLPRGSTCHSKLEAECSGVAQGAWADGGAQAARRMRPRDGAGGWDSNGGLDLGVLKGQLKSLQLTKSSPGCQVDALLLPFSEQEIGRKGNGQTVAGTPRADLPSQSEHSPLSASWLSRGQRQVGREEMRGQRAEGRMGSRGEDGRAEVSKK